MDSNDIEKERGITILSKNTAVEYKGVNINIVDTPGHADFGGEVERVLKMVDASLLLVDAFEGPMPQTRFVLKKALELGQKIILVINKIDRPGSEPIKVIDQTYELFMELNASNEQMDFPVIFASAKNGYAVNEVTDTPVDIAPLMDLILEKAPDVTGDPEGPFQFQVMTLDYSEYLGRICIGRVFEGNLKVGDTVKLVGINEKGEETVGRHKITKLFRFLGLDRLETDRIEAGDISAVAGIPEMTIGDTLCAEEVTKALPRIEVEPPTVSMMFLVNDSPFAGKEGKMVTSRNIRDRLQKELMTNLSLQVEDLGDSFRVAARGELQLAILIENMRREGFELGVSRPEVILKEIDGKKHEPYEILVMDMPEEFSGKVIQELNRRKGYMRLLTQLGEKSVRIEYEIPTRGIIGFRTFFLTETRGEGTFSSIFLEFREFSGTIAGRIRGVLVTMENGKTSAYSLFSVQERGDLYVNAATDVYVGMIIGLHNKDNDLDVNPVREKKQSNVRSTGADEAIRLIPPRILTLEESMDLLEDDEILEVTPKSLRLRKKVLNPALRKKRK